MSLSFRIGFGLDSHAFCPDYNVRKPLILAGVIFSDRLSLQANSDGDVVAHAVFNALSQAIGDRSIGYYADSMCLEQEITDSKEYLKVILQKIKQQNYLIGNMGITMEAKRPKMEKYADQMKQSLASILNMKENQLGFTFTSGEGLTAFGKGLGIQAQAVCLLIRQS
jgi:2-C-methyl-D-erythritol 2,4-cyclodiphosphate synthase